MTLEITMDQFRHEYLDYRKGVVMPSTALADDLALRKFAKDVGHRTPLPRIRPRHGDQFMSRCARAGLKPTSTTNHYRHLHRAFETAKLWEYVQDNPFAEVKPPRIYKRPPQYIPLEQCAAFVNGIEDHGKRMLITAYLATGRRRCELLDLHWSDIDWDRSEYTVHVTKIHRDLVFPINDLFHDVLVEQCIFEGHAIRVFPRWENPDSVTHWVKIELQRAGLGHLHLHNLRHSFASGYIEAGGDIYVLMKLLGHSVVTTTMIYADVSRDRIATEANRVAWLQ